MPDPIPVYIGDDWSIPITLKDADGAPIDLTGCTPGGVLWVASHAEPTAELPFLPEPIDWDEPVTGISMTAPATSGQIVVLIDKSLTKDVPPSPTRDPLPNRPPNSASPTRIRVYIDDPNGERQTYVILYLKVLDPRTA